MQYNNTPTPHFVQRTELEWSIHTDEILARIKQLAEMQIGHDEYLEQYHKADTAFHTSSNT